MGAISNLFLLLPKEVAVPDWGWLGWFLNNINTVLGNAAWTMICFTIVIKLATFPLDYISRYKMKKNAVIMEELKPQLEKLEKQCKGDKQLYNQRSYPLLKKNGYSAGGACLPTLITLVLFICIFNGLNSYATYRNAVNYNEVVKVYNQQYISLTEGGDALDPVEDREQIQEKINPYLIEKYNEINPSWLWIKNPWRPDVSFSDGFFKAVAGVNPIPSYDEFSHVNGKSNFGVKPLTVPSDGDSAAAKMDYNKVMGAIIEDKGTGNGLYILVAVSVAVSFLSQFIMQKVQGQQQQQQMGGMGAGTMKTMLIIFPLMLGFFSFSYSAVFTLYIITNSTFSVIATLVISKAVEKKMEKLRREQFAEIKYRREGK